MRSLPQLDLPLALRAALESGSATLFLGAGIGFHAFKPDGSAAPTALELARRLAAHFGLDAGATPDLAKVAEVVEQRKGRDVLDAFLSDQLQDLEPDENLVWLLSRTWKAIYTTNYDRVIQRTYEKIRRPTQRPVTFSTSRDLTYVDPRFEVPVYHLHGSLFEGDHRYALITRSDYARFREQRAMLFESLKISYATSPILYVGYSNQDPNWDTVIAEVQAEFTPSMPPESFRVSPDTPSLDVELLAGQGVATLVGGLEDFVACCQRSIGDIRVEPARLDLIKRSVPADLQGVFDESPAATARLLNSWSYVNQEAFTDHPNTSAFLKGDAANWACLGQNVPFQRDLEDPLVDEMLDYATDPSRSTRTALVLGPAGYGTSTLLRSVAIRLAEERVGSVLCHKPNGAFIDGDVLFALGALPQPVVFIVDNASDAGEALPAAISAARDSSAGAIFLLGDRLNEWRSRRLRVRPREFLLEALSDDEINRLLDCLESNGSLGVLRDLPRELQFSAVKLKHGKELLVAMWEATAGEAFGAIIEDEYWSLRSDDARAIYGFTASLYRTRAIARDSLASSALGVNIVRIYDVVKDELDGVVVLDVIDEAREIVAIRPRHHVIADLVWSRCLDSTAREQFLLRAIEHLNLNYGADARAFERLVRSDEAVDSLTDLEARIGFFEQAVKKDPLSPYVRQHYARMFRRAGKFEFALEQVRAGLELDESVRVLHHTKGVILSDMTAATSSNEVARRRLVQAEQAFRQVLRMSPRDEYGHQGLAELYLMWARRTPDEQESVEYLRKCEVTISDGLRQVKNREGLWIVSSQVAEYLDDAPGVVQALKKAVADSDVPGIARYLLARELFKAADYSGAVDLVKPLLEMNPDQYRAALLYARALYLQGRPLDDSLALLVLAETSGLSDARYLAMLGGLQFLKGDFGTATRTLQRWTDLNLPVNDVNRVNFTDERGGRRVGTVQRVRSGYTFIRVPGLPDVFCPGSEFHDRNVREGDTVSFELGFSARGPVAVELRDA